MVDAVGVGFGPGEQVGHLCVVEHDRGAGWGGGVADVVAGQALWALVAVEPVPGNDRGMEGVALRRGEGFGDRQQQARVVVAQHAFRAALVPLGLEEAAQVIGQGFERPRAEQRDDVFVAVDGVDEGFQPGPLGRIYAQQQRAEVGDGDFRGVFEQFGQLWRVGLLCQFLQQRVVEAGGVDQQVEVLGLQLLGVDP